MKVHIEHGFAIGKLTGLTWREVDNYAAELSRSDGDVYYRELFVCTVYNDENGGDTVDADGIHMTDERVQACIDEIDKCYQTTPCSRCGRPSGEEHSGTAAWVLCGECDEIADARGIPWELRGEWLNERVEIDRKGQK